MQFKVISERPTNKHATVEKLFVAEKNFSPRYFTYSHYLFMPGYVILRHGHLTGRMQAAKMGSSPS
jgi:hypothetical protein